MKNLLAFLLVSFIPLFSFAQINFAVKAHVKTADGYPASGNVMALSPQDSSFIDGLFFLDGEFELSNLQHPEILLQFSSLEFEDLYVPVKYQGDEVLDLGEIRVQKSGIALNEVVVSGRRAIYSQKADGTLSVLIENTALAASNTVTEILTKSPDVLIDEEGSISLFGKGNAIIFLNGVRISDAQLNLIAPSNIKKLEIIRNPSAKYDADGAAVINIITINKKGEGYQVNIKQNITYSNFAKEDLLSSVNLSLNKNRFSSNAYYSILHGNDRHILRTTRNRDDEAIFLSSDLTTEWIHRYKNFSNYGLGLQYELDDRSYLSLEYSGFSEDLGGNQLTQNNIIDNESANLYKSNIERDELDLNNSISLNYNKTLDTLGASLFIGGQYAKFSNARDNFISETREGQFDSSSRLLKNVFDLDVGILSIQADYTKIFDDKSILEVGAKFSQAENGSKLDFLIADDEQNYILEEEFFNNFKYKESVQAAYLSYSAQLNNTVTYSLGLRTEFTDYTLKLSQLDQRNIADRYLNFFPNVSINKKYSDNFNLNFAYTSSINRPAYQRLNPVLLYQDPYTSIQGNPESIPEKTHAFEGNAQVGNTSFKLGYSHTIDPFGGGAVRGADDKSYILKRLNFDKKHLFYASVSKTFSNSWWTSTNNLNVKFTNTEETRFGFEQVPFKPNFYFYTNNNFKVSNLFNVELLFYYLGDNYDGVYHRYETYNLALTLEKSFFDNALKCRFIANDLLKSVNASGDYTVGETDIFFTRRWNTDYVRLSLSYNFGKLKENKFKNKSVGQSENSRAQ